MPEFVKELRHQHQRTRAQLNGAVAARDEALAEAMSARLSELKEIAARNGVSLV